MNFESFPFVIGWELTLACNLRCRHCGSSAGRPRENELSTKEALELCDQFPALLVQEVDFTGGEPLLRNDWFDIAIYLKDLGIPVQMVTNGTLITQDTIDLLKEAGISGMGISLDGLEQTHDYIRGDGVFKQALKGLDALQEADISLTVLTTVNSQNINELGSLFNLLVSKGVKGWRVQPSTMSGRCREFPNLQINEHTYLKLEEFVRDTWAVAGKAGLKLLRSDGLGYFYEHETGDNPWYGCTSGVTTCGITSDGRIKGCLALPDDFIEGDLRNIGLWDLWFDKKSFGYTRNFSKNDLGSNCLTCDKSQQCKGGCSAKSFSYTSRLHNDPYCLYRICREN
jgi:radical SAM protein with 4Fe4S-binding SPASM domain